MVGYDDLNEITAGSNFSEGAERSAVKTEVTFVLVGYDAL